MAFYSVSIDNEEVSELADVISITGRVNKVNCAAKVRISQQKQLPAAEQKRSRQTALIEAYLAITAADSDDEGEKVSV